MATRSTIGYVKANGTVNAVYCNWDGYPEKMVAAIESFIAMRGVRKFMAEVRRAQKQGGVRSMYPYAVETYGDVRDGLGNRGNVMDPSDVTYTRDEIENGRFEEYCYLVDSRSGEITEYRDHHGNTTVEAMRARLEE